jgi:hypothetical protein
MGGGSLQAPGHTPNRPYSFVRKPMIFLWGRFELESTRSLTMEWVTPRHEEVDLNCEVSSYANAEL